MRQNINKLSELDDVLQQCTEEKNSNLI